MGVGPIQYMIVGFPGNKFNGEIAPELGKLIDSGLIRILDLVIVGKDADGDVAAFEYDELAELAAFGDLDGEVGGILGPEDIAYVGASLEPGSTVGMLLWENVWAAPFADSLRDSGGVLLESGLIPHDLAQEALAVLEALA